MTSDNELAGRLLEITRIFDRPARWCSTCGRMTLRQAVFNTSANRDGHRHGWSGSFDRLDQYLRTL